MFLQAGVLPRTPLCVALLSFLSPLSALAQSSGALSEISARRFEVRGNALLTYQQVDDAVGRIPASLTLTEINAAAARLQQAYRRAGYGAVVVIVPEQTIGDAVTLLVIEGKLRQRVVAGNKEFSVENVLRGLPSLQLGETPRLDTLDRELLMVNENPAKSARVIFQPGAQSSDVEALVVLEEQPTAQWQLSLDNTGNASTGRLRTWAFYQNANVGDSDAVFGLRAGTSLTRPSQVAVLSSTMRVPLYLHKTFLEASLVASNTRASTNTTPAGDLRFSGRGLAIGGRAVWLLPSLAQGKTQASLGLDARSYRNDCSLGTLGAAGCGPAAASVDVLPLTAGWTWNVPGSRSFGAQLVANLPFGRAGDDARFDASRPGARSRYQLLRLNGSGVENFGRTEQLLWRANAQLTRDALVSAEQFGIGGTSSVRGYEERALAGDHGATASLELRHALSGSPLGVVPGTAAVWLFADAGQVRSHLGTTCASGRSSCSLWGVGAGLTARPTPASLVRLDLARAGRAAGATARGDWRLHVNLNYEL